MLDSAMKEGPQSRFRSLRSGRTSAAGSLTIVMRGLVTALGRDLARGEMLVHRTHCPIGCEPDHRRRTARNAAPPERACDPAALNPPPLRLNRMAFPATRL